jgi:type IV pilus assembly protein PilB
MAIPLPLDQIEKILVDNGVITPELFSELKIEADRKEQNILDVLVASGGIEKGYLDDVLAKTLGVARVDFSAHPINKDIVKLIPENIARERQVFVFDKEQDGSYDVAMLDPSDLETIEFLEQRLKGFIHPFFATEDDLKSGFSIYGYELGQDFKKIIEQNIAAASLLATQSKDVAATATELPIVGLTDNIISYAMASRASDIHIEVLESSMLIRYRIDGILYSVMEVTKKIYPAVVARFKLLAGMKIDEHMKPQDGRFRYQVTNQQIDVRVSVIPTFYGEKVEMRLLESSQKPLSLSEIGIMPEDEKVILENLKKTYGMILSCGPTGSGKTTTLYTFMNILNRPEVNITTVEDPIEYNMPYVNQTQINDQAGISFASGLRALLRQDPNIIMVGEIRDSETADIAVQAALTGHLLLSSLHTNDAPTTIPRLFDLGVAPFLASSVLNLIVAQRLVRKICQKCVRSYEPGPEIEGVIENQFNQAGIPFDKKFVPKVLYKGDGCSACGGTGYSGRMGIFELLQVNDEIKKIISQKNFSLDELSKEARKAGMKTMFEDGLQKVELAQTTLEEVLRVIME